LKDRIGSEIRTHYPATLEEGISITTQEAWAKRDGHPLEVPAYIGEVVEQIAFTAREDKKIDKRSGVSQRLPISVMENVISNAERRAYRNGEKAVVPRISDIYAALPAITGKLELEYEGEMRGGDTVAREIIRVAIAKTYDQYFANAKVEPVVQWFDLGGQIQVSDNASAKSVLGSLREIQGLMEKLGAVKVNSHSSAEAQVSAAEFLLEGLHAHKRIGRSEERIFKADKQAKKPERAFERENDPQEDFPPRKNRRPYN
jgi:magnesium chelatase subunit I